MNTSFTQTPPRRANLLVLACALVLGAVVIRLLPPASSDTRLSAVTVVAADTASSALKVSWLQAAETPGPHEERVIVLGRASRAGAASQAQAAFADVERPHKCNLTELQLGWHISSKCSYDEGESSAAGPMVCQIQRNSCAFNQLIDNRDPDVLFYREEPAPFNDEDSLMHPAMLLPLSRLRDLVSQEWRGEVQLMVTDAYDSLGDHDLNQPVLGQKYSQHFEGRSIDLVTWPVDTTRYARLCAMALDAGFDWVHNEGDHCHASIAAESLCSVCSPIASGTTH